MAIKRRALLRAGVTIGLVGGLGMAEWRRVFAATSVGDGPYGALESPDANGIALPSGFTYRIVAVAGRPVDGTHYVWHARPDGGATFAAPDGGWVYVSNSEVIGGRGGVGALRFGRNGELTDAYRILSDTNQNCAGGATPWKTWLSCEETRDGRVWECDPLVPGQGVARPALGAFEHEAAVVDPATSFVYMTEDHHAGRLYRFRPDVYGDLSSGVLEAAAVASSGGTSWVRVGNERAYRGADTTSFSRGEGAWFSRGLLYFCTTADNRVWALDTANDTLEMIYDAARLDPATPLRKPDNVTVHERSGDVYVAEDGDDLQLCLLANASNDRIVAPFLRLLGQSGSEVTGPAFSPDGSRLYVSSQRGIDGNGITYEITGPFR